MENFAPGLRETIVLVAGSLRAVVFFLCVVGLMIQVNSSAATAEGVVRPLVKAIVITGLVALLPNWFSLTEKIFLSAADTIEAGYTEHPMRASTALRDAVQEKADNGFTLRRVGETLYRATLWAIARLIVIVASVLQLPFLLLQYVLKLLCYLFLPVALGLYMVPGLSPLATRYIQQTLAVLAWPIGFAVTELVAYHLMTSYYTNVAIGFGLAPGQLDASSMAGLLGALLGALWLILGTLGTPFLMQALFCSGAPMSSGGPPAVQTIQQIALMVKAVKTGGAAAPVATAATAKNSSGGNGSPPPAPAASSAPPPAPVPPKNDPAGDGRAAATLARAALPAPQTTI